MKTNQQRMALMEQILQRAFQPQLLKITDDSAKHAGHAGAQSGLGHFSLDIHAQAFTGRSSVEIHRLIYQALGDLMQTDIHALCICAKGLDADE